MMDKKAYWSWSDLSTWAPLLDSLSDEASTEEIRVALRRMYAGYRAFHGCKPFDVDTYRRDGIVAHDRDELHAAVKDRIRQSYPSIDAAHIDRAIVAATPLGGRSEVCAFIDRRYSVDRGKEFCVRGSEMPLRVAARLHDYSGVNVSHLFSDSGTPTLIEFGVDWIIGPRHMKVELPDYVQEALGHARQGIAPRVLDWPHVQLTTVSPNRIFGIEHPTFGE